MNRIDAIDEIVDILRHLNDSELVELHNDNVSYDTEIHFIDEFNSDVAEMTPLEIVECTKDLDVTDTFYRWSDWGEAESTCDIEEWWNLEDFAEELIDDDDDLGFKSIRRVLDAIEGEDDE